MHFQFLFFGWFVHDTFLQYWKPFFSLLQMTQSGQRETHQKSVIIIHSKDCGKKRKVWSDKLQLDVKNFKVLQMLRQSTPLKCLTTFKNRLVAEERTSSSSEYCCCKAERSTIESWHCFNVVVIAWNHSYVHLSIFYSYTRGRGEGLRGVFEPTAAVSWWRQGYTLGKVPVYLKVCMKSLSFFFIQS